MPMAALPHLVEGLDALGCEISPGQIAMFETYRDELLRWNRGTNLTAITDPVEIEIRHFLDSLTLLKALDVRDTTTDLNLLDVGAGAGFPGIPLKVILSDARLVLLEATGKKAAFLSHVVRLLGLKDTTVVHGRAEVLAHDVAHRERYDVVVARAVAPLATLAELCLPFATVGGQFVAPKKGDFALETAAAHRAIEVLGGGLVQFIDVQVPHLGDGRTLACVTKIAATPERYPRRTGMPAKRPL